MTIDLDNLTKEQQAIFNANIDEALTLYNDLSSELLEKSDALAWLVNNVTSRNTVFSNLLLDIRYLLLVEEISKQRLIKTIVTKDPLLAKILGQKFVVTCNVTSTKGWIEGCYSKFKRFGFSFLWSLAAMRCKSKERVENIVRTGADIDIDIFRETNSLEDRYYGNVLDTIPEDQVHRFFYQVIYLLIPKRKVIDNIANNTKYNLVYLWDFLRPIDYLWAFRQIFRKFPSKMLHYEMLGYDLTPLLKTVSRDSNAFYYFLAYLYTRVVAGMKRARIQLHVFVDWFENQSFDKSLYWAMNKYYPDVPVHAYMGIMADTKVNPITIATNTELNKSIAPKYVFVCNQAFKHQYEQSGYKGVVEVAPFYRSQKVWNFRRDNRDGAKEFNLFVPLGIFVDEVTYKTKMILDIMNKIPSDNIRVFIKMHPSSDESMVTSMLNGVKNIELVKGDFYQHLAYADAVVASNSTTTYEALASGIPALYFIDPDNKFCLGKPDGVDDSMWYDVADAAQFEKSVAAIKRMDAASLAEKGNAIKAYYFEPVSMELTKKLFLLD